MNFNNNVWFYSILNEKKILVWNEPSFPNASLCTSSNKDMLPQNPSSMGIFHNND
jgi:hypothetical protein